MATKNSTFSFSDKLRFIAFIIIFGTSIYFINQYKLDENEIEDLCGYDMSCAESQRGEFYIGKGSLYVFAFLLSAGITASGTKPNKPGDSKESECT